MKNIWSRINATAAPAVIVIVAIFLLGIGMWILGPRDGDKYSDLGINLAVGAALGMAVLYMESLLGRAEAERERRLAEAQRFMQSLLAATDVKDIRVSGRDLAGSVLPNRDLQGADLTATNLTRADLRRTNLTRADLSLSHADDLNMHGAIVDFLVARSVRWRNAHLTGINGASVDFTHADLEQASLVDARLPRVVLDQANCVGADFRRADLSTCQAVGTIMQRADLRASSLRGATLTGVDFRDADLRAADLSSAVIQDADLRGADLRDCRVDGLSIKGSQTDARTRLPILMSSPQANTSL